MRDTLALANQAPLASADMLRDQFGRLSGRIGMIANYAALMLAVAVATIASGPHWIGLYLAIGLSFSLAIPLPMMERRGLTVFAGPWRGLDAYAFSVLAACLFVHTVWDRRELHGGAGAYLAELCSFILLPALFDLMAKVRKA